MPGPSTLGGSGLSLPGRSMMKKIVLFMLLLILMLMMMMMKIMMMKTVLMLIERCNHLMHKSTEEHIISTTENLHKFLKFRSDHCGHKNYSHKKKMMTTLTKKMEVKTRRGINIELKTYWSTLKRLSVRHC